MSTYVAIATVTVGAGGAATINFSSIPQPFTDLVVRVSARSAAAALTDTMQVRPNGLTTNIAGRWVQGNQTTVSSGNGTSMVPAITGNTAAANVFSVTEIHLQRYATTDAKPISVRTMTENASGAVLLQIWAGSWAGASALTSLTLATVTSTFQQYTTATLYGIKNS